MSISWIKLKIDMFDDEKIKLIEKNETEKDTIFYIWIRLLMLAGKINDNGYIYLTQNKSYTSKMLETIFNRKSVTICNALRVLQELEMIKMCNDGKIKVINFLKHQNAEAMEKIRKQTRKRVQKYRKKQKDIEYGQNLFSDDMIKNVTESNVTVTPRIDKNRIDKNRIDKNNIDDIKSSKKQKEITNFEPFEKYYFELFQKIMPDIKPDYVYARDRKLLKPLIEQYGNDMMIKILDIWFKSDFGKQTGFSIPQMKYSINSLLIKLSQYEKRGKNGFGFKK